MARNWVLLLSRIAENPGQSVNQLASDFPLEKEARQTAGFFSRKLRALSARHELPHKS
jgi:hypothetical protein